MTQMLCARKGKLYFGSTILCECRKRQENQAGKKLNAKDMVTLVQPLMAQYGFSGPFEKYKGDK